MSDIGYGDTPRRGANLCGLPDADGPQRHHIQDFVAVAPGLPGTIQGIGGELEHGAEGCRYACIGDSEADAECEGNGLILSSETRRGNPGSQALDQLRGTVMIRLAGNDEEGLAIPSP